MFDDFFQGSNFGQWKTNTWISINDVFPTRDFTALEKTRDKKEQVVYKLKPDRFHGSWVHFSWTYRNTEKMFEKMELELHESGMCYLTLGERLVFNFMAPSSAAVRGMSYSRRDKLILQDKVGRRSNLCKLLWVIFCFFGVLKEIQLVDPGWWSLIARHPYVFDKLGVCCGQLSGYDRFKSWVGWFNPPFSTV